MPRFFLDITTNGDLAQDEEGQEFSNEAEAHREAVIALAEIAADRIPEDGALYLAVTVCDEHRHIIVRTHMHFEPGNQK